MAKRIFTILALLLLSASAPAQAAPPTALFIGPPEWMTDPTIYEPLVTELSERGYVIRNFGLPWNGDLNQWRVAATNYANWISDYVTVFGTSPTGLPSLGSGPIVVIGTSRGAFCAFELAAAYPQIHYAVGISPLIDVTQIAEFAGFTNPLRVETNLYGHATQLKGRSIFMEIGSQDYRVGTAPADFLAYYIGMAATTGAPNYTIVTQPDVTVRIEASDGHSPPADTVANVVAWLAAKVQ